MSDFSGQNTPSDSIIEFYVLQGTFQLSRGTHEIEHKHVDDNEDTIEDDVPETNVRKFVGLTDIVKIVREKQSVFGFYRGKQVMATRNDELRPVSPDSLRSGAPVHRDRFVSSFPTRE